MTTTSDPHLQGTWHPSCAAVVDEFVRNFAERGDVGASFAATRHGKLVVDIWGGYVDTERTRRWERDTIVNTFSTTKGLVSLTVFALIEQGVIELDERVATYWPEFGQNGKDDITVRMVMAHQAGLPTLSKRVRRTDLYDWDCMCRRLAEEAPRYRPGSRAVYHALTYGHLIGEIARRASGAPIDELLQRHITGPTRADFHLGVEGEALARTVDALIPITLPEMRGPHDDAGPHVDTYGRLMNVVNATDYRRAVIPSVNGHGNARAVALAYTIATDPNRSVFGAETIERMRERQLGDVDWQRAGGADKAWACGFMPNWSTRYGPNPAAFGHDGFGGAFGAVDPEAGITVGYVQNQLSDESGWDDRGASLVRALYDCIDASDGPS